MGEYANDAIRQEITEQFGFDPGDLNDEDEPKRPRQVPRLACPMCNKHPKDNGLWQHLRDAHGVTKEEALATAARILEKRDRKSRNNCN